MGSENALSRKHTNGEVVLEEIYGQELILDLHGCDVTKFMRKAIEQYKELGYKDETTNRLAWDHNSGARLLDCVDADLIT